MCHCAPLMKSYVQTDTSCAQFLQTSALEQTAVFVFYMSLVRLFVSSVQGLRPTGPVI